MCYFLSLLSRKPLCINNNKSGEGRLVHFRITYETAEAPKEQRDRSKKQAQRNKAIKKKRKNSAVKTHE